MVESKKGLKQKKTKKSTKKGGYEGYNVVPQYTPQPQRKRPIQQMTPVNSEAESEYAKKIIEKERQLFNKMGQNRKRREEERINQEKKNKDKKKVLNTLKKIIPSPTIEKKIYYHNINNYGKEYKLKKIKIIPFTNIIEGKIKNKSTNPPTKKKVRMILSQNDYKIKVLEKKRNKYQININGPSVNRIEMSNNNNNNNNNNE